MPHLQLGLSSDERHWAGYAVAAGEAIIEARGLTKTYRNGPAEVQALRHVDFTARRGEFIVVLGPSGSGKSTFLNILGGIDRATSGSVLFQGQDITTFNDQALTGYRRDHVGFVFQFYNLVPSLTALENVALVTEIAANPMTPEEALAIVGLSSRSAHFPAQLSGGEQQRVAIARAIAKRPGLLFCDEPTGALDSATGVLVLEALAEANRSTGATTLIITHNAAIQQIADRTLRFADGRIVEEVSNATRKRPDQVSW
ncbi:ABC transporter ATP-binding protein [Paragemmobacter straminiformis]|uniref:ABC transporter ATP-binding protein n=1 Tax=Paragemmobacter straminiformis TaxID=2045119 RepID=A0A842I5E6_9RHOB|nr:ABC transporter ATP-binding protein [Gemmobacter straminiformis]MBC2834587.1 ABC transporter ATP-binding protein [Gemmobacter straminiformis]